MRSFRFLGPLVVFSFALLACSLFGDSFSTPTALPISRITTTPLAVIKTNTPAPTATPIAVKPPDDDISPILPNCTPRTNWYSYTVTGNDTLSSIAQRANITTEALATANCLANPNLIYTGQVIRVPIQLEANSGGPNVPSGCLIGWFFAFSPGIVEANTCPAAPVLSSPAAGEDFEGGRAYYYAATGEFSAPMIYVIYNDGTWAQFIDYYNSSLGASDPNIIAPPGRYQPVRGIGYLWRTNPTVRAKLGWAYEPESDFAGRRQRASASVLFIDHGTRSVVIRLEMNTLTWRVGGHY